MTYPDEKMRRADERATQMARREAINKLVRALRDASFALVELRCLGLYTTLQSTHEAAPGNHATSFESELPMTKHLRVRNIIERYGHYGRLIDWRAELDEQMPAAQRGVTKRHEP